jgi:4-amino-4-deoxy-L-arabinose transferase-like glycosyltransferase
MTASSNQLRVSDRPASLAAVLGVGLVLRVLAAFAVQRYVEGKVPPKLCVFPDTIIYWGLARTIRAGATYQVPLYGLPHYAIRTPGYPLFLAACQALFGQHLLPVRLVQAVLGAGCVWLEYRLVRRVASGESTRGAGIVPLVAAALVAVDPYLVALSVLVLSEALFIPLMLASLWGMSNLWPATGEAETPRRPLLALGTGLAAGAAILARPSWALFVPVMLLLWVITVGRERRGAAVRGAVLVGLGVAILMAPWWIRNARVFDRFVPTALWVGPSLYDGLSPQATGASDMRFLDDPEVRRLDETAMEDTLRARGWAFAREHPGRALQLALIKSARFWSPWPNAEELGAPGVAWVSALVTLPVFALMLVGLWDRRRDPRALVLLAGPLLYFWALHMLFVGSVRYRIPGAVPAMGLAAFGFRRVVFGGKMEEND